MHFLCCADAHRPFDKCIALADGNFRSNADRKNLKPIFLGSLYHRFSSGRKHTIVASAIFLGKFSFAFVKWKEFFPCPCCASSSIRNIPLFTARDINLLWLSWDNGLTLLNQREAFISSVSLSDALKGKIMLSIRLFSIMECSLKAWADCGMQYKATQR